ncbi:MAG: hypothetical protein ACOYUZ_01575 [Patescibacteria group bacterium]
MKPASGKLRKDDDSILDVSAILTKLDGVLDAVNGLKVNATLEVGDIEIGAVELKDATTDTRAEIAAANAGNTTATKVLKVQPVDTAGSVILGGGGGGGSSAGGGNNTYSTEQGDFTATVTDATTNIVLSVDSIGGQSITEANFANAILKVWDASTEEMITITLDDFTWTSGTKTLAVANCTGAFTFATADVVSLTLVGPDKQRDTVADAIKTVEQSPEWAHYISDTFVLTNVPNATPDETTIINMEGYKGWSVHVEKTGGADTFDVDYFASNEDALSTADWLEITPTFASGSATADHIAHPASEMLVTKALKLKVTTAGGANDADFQIFVYRW